MNKKILILPLTIFFFILFIFFYLLVIEREPSKLPSVLLNKKIKTFKAKTLFNNEIFISDDEFGNEIILVNFFATWCKPCMDEHPYIKRLSNKNDLRIIGINYKDDKKKAIKYLEKLGNPYSDVLIDANANIGIDWGVYGLPETFIVDSNSIIKYRLVGPITKNNFEAFISKIKEIKN